jgi:hypothetical protein
VTFSATIRRTVWSLEDALQKSQRQPLIKADVRECAAAPIIVDPRHKARLAPCDPVGLPKEYQDLAAHESGRIDVF